jgi:hypothetical protein
MFLFLTYHFGRCAEACSVVFPGAQSPSYMLYMVANLFLDYPAGKDTYIGMIPRGQGFGTCFLL